MLWVCNLNKLLYWPSLNLYYFGSYGPKCLCTIRRWAKFFIFYYSHCYKQLVGSARALHVSNSFYFFLFVSVFFLSRDFYCQLSLSLFFYFSLSLPFIFISISLSLYISLYISLSLYTSLSLPLSLLISLSFSLSLSLSVLYLFLSG